MLLNCACCGGGGGNDLGNYWFLRTDSHRIGKKKVAILTLDFFDIGDFNTSDSVEVVILVLKIETNYHAHSFLENRGLFSFHHNWVFGLYDV